jgi:hypothetical protein
MGLFKMEMGEGRLPFIDCKYLHAEHGHNPTQSGYNHNSNEHGDVFSRDSGQNLTPNDAVDHAVAQIGENVQCAADFAGIISHKEAAHDL